MNTIDTARTFRALALSFFVASLAACGGGSDTAPSGAPMLGPDASAVTSSDGKVTVSVGANALQAPAAVSIAAATPDATTAADPSLVPGTTYTYTAPDIQVPDQVLIEIESPAAVAAAAGAGFARALREFALALPPNYQPPPTCLVNAPSVLNGSQTAQNILVTSGLSTQAQCPQAPAPGCIIVFNPNPDVFVCAPSQDLILVPSVADACPPGYREVTSEAEFADLAAANGFARVCQRNGDSTPPVLRGASGALLANCAPKSGKFVCSAPKLPSGTYSVLWDKQQPPDFAFNAKSTSDGTFVYKDELDTDAVFRARIIATDPNGLGAAEILEIFETPASNIALGKLRNERIWQASASTFSGAAVKDYNSGPLLLPFDNSAPAKRRFMARVFDKAGNSNLSNPIVSLDFFIARIGIDSFTAAPPSVQFPGGPLTLNWAVKGATTVSIDNGGGSVTLADNALQATTGSTTVNVTGTTTFTLTATHPKRATKTATVTVTLGADATPPSVSLAASPSAVVAPGSTTLTATASDNAGVAKVEFFRGTTLIGTDTTAPFTQAVSFTPADIGNVAFTAKAYDAANNSTTSAAVSVTVGADMTPPTVSVAANPATVLVPGATTLLATAADNIGVTKVEFRRGATLIATVNAPPFQTGVNFTAADLGTVAFTAKAFDAQNNNTTSSVVNVLVSTPAAGDTYASPTGTDAGNTSCLQASPCRSIAQAAAAAAANGTVWLMNGIYTHATQPAPIAIPAGRTLRALTPGLAEIGQNIVLQGSANVIGIVIRRFNFGDQSSLSASSGTVLLDGVRVIGSAIVSSSGLAAPFVLTGTVQATMTPGNITDYADQLTPVGQSSAAYATLADSARLTLNGGLFGGAALGGADGVYGSSGRAAFHLAGTSRLDLNNVVLNVDSAAVYMAGGATQLHLNATQLKSNVNTGGGVGIHAALGTPLIALTNSSITGFKSSYTAGSTGIAVGTFAQPGVVATVTATGSSLIDNDLGIQVVDNSSSPSSLTLTGTAFTVANNGHGGIVCFDACNVDLSSAELSENGSSVTGLGSMFYGGVWMGRSARVYQLKLRNMIIVDNRSTGGSNAASADNSGVTMAGTAASVWDLGTAASPGNNLIQGNTSSAQTSGLYVAVAAGVTVQAVGNTFAPNQQGANAQGKYTLGNAPCGASSCNVGSGAGPNYRVTSGTLRLAQ